MRFAAMDSLRPNQPSVSIQYTFTLGLPFCEGRENNKRLTAK